MPTIIGPAFEGTATLSKAKNGSIKSHDVLSLRVFLMKWGFYTGDLTGIFDVDLETSVKKWQGHRGLTVTGVIDADDRAAILGSRHLPSFLATYSKYCTGVERKRSHVSHSRPHRRSPAASHAVPSTAEVGPGMVPMWLSAEVTYSTTNHDPLL